jgi:manganese/zinc/iron transport system permease protein
MLALLDDDVLRVLLLRDYNTRVVLLGTMLLGMCGGVVGVFMLLRKRSLVGDVVGHAALPGIALAFLFTEAMRPGLGKSVPILLLGALLAGVAGALCVMLIDRYSRIKADASLAIVLSLFYGVGAALLTVVQRTPTGSAAGLQDYLDGKTASLIAVDVWLFAGSAVVLLVVTLLLSKELTLLCFDADFAASLGWRVFLLDGLLTGLVVGVTIIGMQSVGLILVVAILIIPAASARFWTDDVFRMIWISAGIGAVAAASGTLLSALYAKVAAGAVIVLSGSGLFVLSLCFGTRRGIFWRWSAQRRIRRRTGRHDLLRAIYELAESLQAEAADETGEPDDAALLQFPVTRETLLCKRGWDRRRLETLIRDAVRERLLAPQGDGTFRLTPDGAALARRAVRNHRLWELYLITYADIAPSHVDRDADQIEHVLDADVIRELERRMPGAMPPSPHPLGGSG